MSGLILSDVSYEEKEEFDVVLKKYGLDLISMIAQPVINVFKRLPKMQVALFIAYLH